MPRAAASTRTNVLLMKFPTLLQEKFGFTRNEIKVVLFLSTTLIIGAAIQMVPFGEPSVSPSPLR